LGTATFTTLSNELAVAERAGKKQGEVTELYLKLKALIFLQPQVCVKLVKDLAGKPFNTLSFTMVTGTLAAIASPEAQDALVSLIKMRQKEPDTIVQLIPVLGMMEEPTIASESALRDLAYRNRNEDIATTAQLSLSIMARTVSYDDHDRARRIIDEIIDHYGATKEQDDIHKLLLMLGNVAMDVYLPKLLAFTHDVRAEVRSSAVFALRSYPVEKVWGTLIQAVTSDRDATTRREAARALGFLRADEKSIAALTSVYNSEKIMEIRLEVLKSLWKWEKSHPEIRRLVRQAAEQDESEDLRTAVKGMMNVYSEEYFR
ncbi:MAG: HEAT repeat domain-containing protein, partial [Deltaproteobacteria bacterium]